MTSLPISKNLAVAKCLIRDCLDEWAPVHDALFGLDENKRKEKFQSIAQFLLDNNKRPKHTHPLQLGHLDDDQNWDVVKTSFEDVTLEALYYMPLVFDPSPLANFVNITDTPSSSMVVYKQYKTFSTHAQCTHLLSQKSIKLIKSICLISRSSRHGRIENNCVHVCHTWRTYNVLNEKNTGWHSIHSHSKSHIGSASHFHAFCHHHLPTFVQIVLSFHLAGAVVLRALVQTAVTPLEQLGTQGGFESLSASSTSWTENLWADAVALIVVVLECTTFPMTVLAFNVTFSIVDFPLSLQTGTKFAPHISSSIVWLVTDRFTVVAEFRALASRPISTPIYFKETSSCDFIFVFSEMSSCLCRSFIEEEKVSYLHTLLVKAGNVCTQKPLAYIVQ
ncbi:hypothetical protein BJ741DRAFT_581611 [Chytriomyces cf. hyalinus JEL632]|nr:hypothetical protein BJ741DRAFT_581611 [Chytriomyces cf. hyalinus JEL632]